ncbi:MAG TPA: hypothetical protein PKM26_08945, partial [Syntrophorhabdaceae bacterium]|nr:hypothetical protein [Syntrophorhabdaceae bacterium]
LSIGKLCGDKTRHLAIGIAFEAVNEGHRVPIHAIGNIVLLSFVDCIEMCYGNHLVEIVPLFAGTGNNLHQNTLLFK